MPDDLGECSCPLPLSARQWIKCTWFTALTVPKRHLYATQLTLHPHRIDNLKAKAVKCLFRLTSSERNERENDETSNLKITDEERFLLHMIPMI